MKIGDSESKSENAQSVVSAETFGYGWRHIKLICFRCIRYSSFTGRCPFLFLPFALAVVIRFTSISLPICFTDALLIYLQLSIQPYSTSHGQCCRFRHTFSVNTARAFLLFFTREHKFMLLESEAFSSTSQVAVSCSLFRGRRLSRIFRFCD
jgi:hypothetical protein